MREIIYIQAGKYSNYVGTHFWNTQEAYFDYTPLQDGEQPKKPDVDHDISFREGEGRDGTATYRPRLLIFDSRDNFGALPKLDDLYAAPNDLTGDFDLGAGGFEEIRQPLIEPSDYQKNLDEEENPSGSALKGDHLVTTTETRYWSDYSRVFYHPRTVQPVTWGFAEGPSSWDSGRAAFEAMNEETGLMEESFRLFAEECDWLQGFQTSFDSLSFGAFTLSLLETVEVEYPKKGILAIPFLSPKQSTLDYSDTSGAFSFITDAIVARDLASLALAVPLAHTSTWASNSAPLSRYIEFESSSLYQTSAIVSAHLESATLSLRHRTGSQDIVELASKLNWRNDSPFACLEGALPVPRSSASVSSYNFTMPLEPETSGPVNAQSTVVRCDDSQLANRIAQSITLRSSKAGLHPSLLHVSTYRSYPLPSSYPKFFKEPTDSENTVMYSSLVSRPTVTAATLQAYSTYVKQYVRRGDLSQKCWSGLEKDDLNELAEDLMRLSDSVAVDVDSKEADESADAEEYEVDD
ncbi:mtDNA inheritance, partitioning of the mitochondrial organelle [Tulasnella sp. 424]|nr:mtDNA inheritance, partitioning of the mitochondrial organelle [Tulasnella sp. 424]KAG8981924.1 mtDNA inheritance, partitioning of the mitochondrial organelle [Tulasnella sp. 425]